MPLPPVQVLLFANDTNFTASPGQAPVEVLAGNVKTTLDISRWWGAAPLLTAQTHTHTQSPPHTHMHTYTPHPPTPPTPTPPPLGRYGYSFGCSKAGVWHITDRTFQLYPGYEVSPEHFKCEQLQHKPPANAIAGSVSQLAVERLSLAGSSVRLVT